MSGTCRPRRSICARTFRATSSGPPSFAADRLSMPIITFPEGEALADVTAAVLDALLEAQGRRLQRVLDIHQRFTRIVLAGGGATEIASTLHTLLGCPVAMVDANGRPTLVVPSDATTTSTWRHVRCPPADPRRRPPIRRDRRPHGRRTPRTVRVELTVDPISPASRTERSHSERRAAAGRGESPRPCRRPEPRRHGPRPRDHPSTARWTTSSTTP